jgi:hypothetical protein
LAYSDDSGATWRDNLLRVNDISEKESQGKAVTWNNEVSSLVYDPDAPIEARWRLFWHHYALIDGDGRFQHGWIAYKAAAAPEQLALAREVKLLGAAGYDPVNDGEGWTASPVAGPPVIRANELNPALKRCLALSEPGALSTPRGLYLAITCEELTFWPPGIHGKVILLDCRRPCDPTAHGAWRYVSTLLGREEAKAWGSDAFSAPDLYSDQGRIYLIVSPGSNRPVPNSYNGCLFFRFADIATGGLERAGALPQPVGRVVGTPGSFNGACSYRPTVPGAGVLYGEITFTANRPYFRLFRQAPPFSAAVPVL